MNKRVVIFLVFLWVITLSAVNLFAQSKKDLEQKKQQLQKEIKVTNKMLEETKKNKKLSLNQLLTLNKKISIREELIGTMTDEVNSLDKVIEENVTLINNLQKDLNELKVEYAQMIYFAYKTKSSYNRLMFIFSSKDFNQAYTRLKYLQQYSEYRRKQAAMIVSTQQLINKKIGELQDRKNEKLGIVKDKEVEINNLNSEKSEKEKMLVELQDKEKQLKADLKKKQADASRLQQAIQQIISDEIRKAKEEAMRKATEERKKQELANNSVKNKNTKDPGKDKKGNTENKTTPAVAEPKLSSSGFYLSAEAEKLSNNFEGNKSKLPRPVADGIITLTFGEHEHPVLKNIKIKNNGVDFSTVKNAMARAVFDGEVSGVISTPDGGQAIIIRHGEYLTVYSHLKEVYVKKGDKVKTMQNIALIEVDEESGKCEIHFELWKGYVTLNPELWLRSK